MHSGLVSKRHVDFSCCYTLVWFCYNNPCYKVMCARQWSLKQCSNSEINPTNDFCSTQYGCDQKNRASEKKLPLSLVPGKEISRSRSSLISRCGKRGILKRSMSSLQLLCCLELPWCSVSKGQIGFPSLSFLSRFFHKCRQKIYLQLVFLIADFFHGEPYRVQ